MLRVQISRPPNQPDYGSDLWHNARLIGAYHAHLWAGADYLVIWRESLSAGDKLRVIAYERRGEWGRTDFHDPVSQTMAESHRAALGKVGAAFSSAIFGLGVAAASIAPTVMQLANAQHRAIERVEEEFAAAGGYADLGSALIRRVSEVNVGDMLIIMERIALRSRLERLRFPPAVACWIARRWPAWALPAVLYYYLCGWADADD